MRRTWPRALLVSAGFVVILASTPSVSPQSTNPCRQEVCNTFAYCESVCGIANCWQSELTCIGGNLYCLVDCRNGNDWYTDCGCTDLCSEGCNGGGEPGGSPVFARKPTPR